MKSPLRRTILIVAGLPPLLVLASPAWATTLVCGDFNNDFAVDAGDHLEAVDYLFFDGPPPVTPALLDVNGDFSIDVGDLIYFDSNQNHGGPPLYCYVVEQQMHGQFLSMAGETLKDTTLYTDPAIKFRTASTFVDSIVQRLRNLETQGVPVDSVTIDKTDSLRIELLNADKAIRTPNYQMLANSMERARDHMQQLYLQRDRGSENAAIVSGWLNTLNSTKDMVDVAEGLQDPGVLPEHYRALDSLFALSPATLDSLGDELLSITDPDMQFWLELEDSTFRDQVDSVWKYQGEIDVIDWMNRAQADAEGLHTNMFTNALFAGTVYLGYDLEVAGLAMVNYVPVLPLALWWSNESCNICDVQDCTVAQVAVVNWNTTCGGEKAKRGLLRVGKKIKKPPKLPLGGAPLQGVALEAVETLQKILTESQRGVRICINVTWEHCENVSGWFCTVKRWVDKEKSGIEVLGPNDPVCWPRPSEWGNGNTKTQIENAIDAKAQATCQ